MFFIHLLTLILSVLSISIICIFNYFFFFFFNDTAPTEIYPLPLHAALPICQDAVAHDFGVEALRAEPPQILILRILLFIRDRKSTRLNSSHLVISYAVFCLKKKKTTNLLPPTTLLKHLYTHTARLATQIASC